MSSAKDQQLNHALKEWAVAVEALEAGATILLLRKGGIREEGNNFQLKYPQVWLYPTYEHQKPHLLKPEYASKVNIVDSGWHPETVRIGSYANITQVLLVREPSQISLLQPYHIWNEQMIGDRLKWKPNQPLSILLLRVYRLSQPKMIAYNPSYGGCKSWLNLTQSISIEGLKPVLDDDTYNRQVAEIAILFG